MDAPAWDPRLPGSERVWSVEPNQFAAAELADLSPARAVDLAAGEVRNAIWLSSLGRDVTTVDFSAVALERGRHAAAERPPAQAEVTRLPGLGVPRGVLPV